MNFKIGDKVRVKSAEEINKNLNAQSNVRYFHEGSWREMHFASDMFNFCGKEYVIREICDNGSYRFCGDPEEWNFIEDWLEPAEIHEESCYVSSFTDEPQTPKEKEFIETILGLENEVQGCLDTDCSECSRHECILYDLQNAIKEYKG